MERDFDLVTNFQNLLIAYKKAKSGGSNRKSVCKFDTQALDGILSLQAELKNKTYKVSPYYEFKVYEPKERIIKSGAFQDAIVQHALCDNVLLSKLSSELIFDNYAGQIGKGTHLGLQRLEYFLGQYQKQSGTDGYILKCDITKFFYNIDHNILKDILRYYFQDQEILWLCDQFIDSTDGLGLPLGNQISQVFAILYLHPLDVFIKSELGIQYYGRYMDDFYIIHPDKDYLKHCLSTITDFVETLNLSLNSKTQIVSLRSGLKFLGFHTYLNADGIITRRVKNDNKRNAIRKYKSMAKLVRSNKITVEKFNEPYQSWIAHLKNNGCDDLIKSSNRLIQKILDG